MMGVDIMHIKMNHKVTCQIITYGKFSYPGYLGRIIKLWFPWLFSNMHLMSTRDETIFWPL